MEPIAAEEVGEADPGMDKDPFEEAWDDVSGNAFDPAMVEIARGEYIIEFRKRGVYDNVPISDCKQVVGKMPIAVMWIAQREIHRTQHTYRYWWQADTE